MQIAKLVPILPLVLAAGAVPAAASPELSPFDLTEAAVRTVDGLLAGELPPAKACTYCKDGCGEECLAQTAAYREKMARNLPAYYASEVAASPELSAQIRPVLLARFSDLGQEQRVVLLDFVSHLPVAKEATLEEKLFKIDPASFSLDHLLTFAGRGAETCEAKVHKWAKKSNAHGDADIRPAVFVALQGGDLGRPALERAATAADLSGGVAPALLAGLGLQALGDHGRLGEVWGGVMDATLAALDNGDLEGARRLVAEAEFFADFQAKYGAKKKKAYTKAAYAKGAGMKKSMKAPLALFGGELEAYCVARSEELSSPEDVFRAIESVTPL